MEPRRSKRLAERPGVVSVSVEVKKARVGRKKKVDEDGAGDDVKAGVEDKVKVEGDGNGNGNVEAKGNLKKDEEGVKVEEDKGEGGEESNDEEGGETGDVPEKNGTAARKEGTGKHDSEESSEKDPEAAEDGDKVEKMDVGGDADVGDEEQKEAVAAEETVEQKGETKSGRSSRKKAKVGAESLRNLAVGDMVPGDLELETDEGKFVLLRDLVANTGVVFFMFPKANTPGCTKQACGFRDEYETLKKTGYEVWGLGADSAKSLSKWKAKYEIKYGFLSDPKLSLIKAFGAHKTGGGVKRSHVIVKKGGEVEVLAIQISPIDSVSKSVEHVKQSET
uniref:thioredoxin-dependent peroxiredoxin n=1 Tax=Compsopogon caeruleus TaxID=31354 RepID=A0A7S1XHT0_9RHOD|mmetsp:Transcript_9828/g.20019  ORF Transcript_9828/g.20019 Transcript_9828/m.20019 type:complete len:335 (+) Transcript_9828:140-1144(+)